MLFKHAFSNMQGKSAASVNAEERSLSYCSSRLASQRVAYSYIKINFKG